MMIQIHHLWLYLPYNLCVAERGLEKYSYCLALTSVVIDLCGFCINTLFLSFNMIICSWFEFQGNCTLVIQKHVIICINICKFKDGSAYY